MPAPSPRTKPFRSLSNGIDARRVRTDRQRRQTGKSRHPCWTDAAFRPAGQHDIRISILDCPKCISNTVGPRSAGCYYAGTFPFESSWMEIFPAAILEIIRGTIKGFTLEGPFVVIFSYSRSTSWSFRYLTLRSHLPGKDLPSQSQSQHPRRLL